MITVNQLKEQRIDSTERFLKELSEKIQNLDSRGLRSYNADVPASADVQKAIDALTESGFKVKRSKGSDYRNGDWDILKINWD